MHRSGGTVWGSGEESTLWNHRWSFPGTNAAHSSTRRNPVRSASRQASTPKESNHMLTVGDKIPAFNLTAVVSLEKGKEFKEITQDSYKGKWLVLFSWPKDFTFICPTE